MTHEVVGRIDESGPDLAALADENESLGKLSDRTVELLRSAGVIRLRDEVGEPVGSTLSVNLIRELLKTATLT
ncbi:hypothetical protein ABZ372_44965, partial [Streptomyces sp. NPDC005921]